MKQRHDVYLLPFDGDKNITQKSGALGTNFIWQEKHKRKSNLGINLSKILINDIVVNLERENSFAKFEQKFVSPLI